MLKPNVLAPLCARALMTSTVRQKPSNINPGYIKIREKYAHFQIDNGKLIHVRGGTLDNMLYAATVGVVSVGLCMCFKVYWDLAWPKKAE